MHDDPPDADRFQVTAFGRQMLGEKTLRYGVVSGSRVVLDAGVFLPNYDRSEPGGSAFDRMPDYEGQSQEG